MPKIAIVAALEREVSALIKNWNRIQREHEGRSFTFFERGDTVVVCGGIGVQAARRAAEAAITLYLPSLVQSGRLRRRSRLEPPSRRSLLAIACA